MKRTKLTIVTIHYMHGHTKSFMVPGQYDEQTGKTTIPNETLRSLTEKCGVTDGTTFSIG